MKLLTTFLFLGILNMPLFAQVLYIDNSPNTELALNGHGLLLADLGIYVDRFDKNGLEIGLTEFSFLKKLPVSESVSLLMGTKLDVYRHNLSGQQDYGVLGSFGVEYAPKENLYINGLMHYRVNSLPNNVYHYNTFSNTSFTVGSGFKF